MSQINPDARRVKRMIFLFGATTLVLAVLFFIEFSKDASANLLGRVPLLALSLGFLIYFIAKYRKLK